MNVRAWFVLQAIAAIALTGCTTARATLVGVDPDGGAITARILRPVVVADTAFLVHDNEAPQIILSAKPPDARERLKLRLRVQEKNDAPENMPAATWLTVGDGAKVCLWRGAFEEVADPRQLVTGRYDFCSVVQPRLR
jgi:hypothetical protein